MQIGTINGKSYLRECLTCQTYEDVCVIDIDNNLLTPDFWSQEEDGTGDIFVYFPLPSNGIYSIYRSRIQEDEIGIERAYADKFVVEIRNDRITKFIMRSRVYDPHDISIDNLGLSDELIFTKVDYDCKNKYREYCLSESPQRNIYFEISKDISKDIEGTIIRMATTPNGETAISVVLEESCCYTRRDIESRLHKALYELSAEKVLYHKTFEYYGEFVIKVSVIIEEDIRDYLDL